MRDELEQRWVQAQQQAVEVEKKNLAAERVRAVDEERNRSVARYRALIQLVDAYTKHAPLGSVPPPGR